MKTHFCVLDISCSSPHTLHIHAHRLQAADGALYSFGSGVNGILGQGHERHVDEPAVMEALRGQKVSQASFWFTIVNATEFAVDIILHSAASAHPSVRSVWGAGVGCGCWRLPSTHHRGWSPLHVRENRHLLHVHPEGRNST